MRPKLRPVVEFLRTESGGGVVLFAGTLAALVWANGPWRASYESFWAIVIGFGPVPLELHGDLRHWINEGAMILFFFVVGLEISRELKIGELREPRTAVLPAIAALGGMAAPAAIYLALNASTPDVRGWAIPMATDIAFAVGVLSLLGPRAPSGLQVFVLSLAIVDDIGAIIVIAAFYTDAVETSWMVGTVAILTIFTVLAQRPRVGWLVLAPLAIAAWYTTLRSGIHPTIAGVALGLLAPVQSNPTFVDLERRLHPYSSYVVVPAFAVANAGVSVDRSGVGDALGSRIFWGVVGGLVLGKLAGITLPSLLAVRTNVARLPTGVRVRDLIGAGALGGIGFTVALFITTLAFGETPDGRTAKTGVLVGSLVAALLGVVILGVRRQSGSRSTSARPRST